MRQKHLIVILFTLLSTVLQAAPVSLEQALGQARLFAAERQAAAARGGKMQQPQLQTVYESSHYYVFNVADRRGFVIVSGDDRTPAILGYSDAGAFDPQNIPTNMQAFLQGYADEIQHLAEGAAGGERRRASAIRSSISPLVTSHWNQTAPYNADCPLIDGERAVTGCVATAMAQVMYFHRYPEEPTKSVAAYSSYAALPATTFDWAKMRDAYANSDDGTAVANLMHYCGQSVKMDYGVSASGAQTSDITNALVSYFDYDASATYVYRNNYTYSEWITLLYNELAERRPMVIGGQSSGGGHAFVCDGYDYDDFFHINWGWGGMSDGYFRLGNLSPDSQGTGGSSSSDGYNTQVGACIGIQPQAGSQAQNPKLTVSNFAIYGDANLTKTYTRTQATQNFYVKVQSNFINWTGKSQTFAYGYRLKQGDETIQDIWKSDGSGIAFGINEYITPNPQLTFGAGLADGTYRIVGICKLGSATEWEECLGTATNYLEAVVSGNSLTITVPKVILEGITFSGTEGLTLGVPTDVTISLTNNGTATFHDDLSLAFLSGNTIHQKLSGTTFDIPAGETRTWTVSVTPAVSGTYDLTLFNGFYGLYQDDKVLAQQSVTIGTPSATVDIALSDYSVNNVGGTIYGNTFKATITAKNQSSDDYTYGFTANLYKVIDNEGHGTLAFAKTINDVLPSGKTTTMTFEFPDLEYGETYFCYVGYYTFSGSTRTFNRTGGYAYTIAHGFVTIDAEGNVTASAPTASVNVPAEAVAVDLRGQSVVSSITPNANPNCVYLFDDGASIPSGITGKNIVKGSTAESLTLTDGYDFRTPIPFTAATVSYTRTFTVGTDGEGGGWTTLCLPFGIDRVTVGGQEKQWFQNGEDTDKHFWVKRFVSDDVGSVSFDFASAIEANTPYIIAVPGGTWGDKWDLRGKPMVFTGTDKYVGSDGSVASGFNYRFIGATKETVAEDIYAMNAAGSSFERGNATVAPFRAYFADSSLASYATSLLITSYAGQPTAISEPVSLRPGGDAIYTLDGRRVSGSWESLPKGVYVKNGVKVIK